jgi:amino acid transporter
MSEEVSWYKVEGSGASPIIFLFFFLYLLMVSVGAIVAGFTKPSQQTKTHAKTETETANILGYAGVGTTFFVILLGLWFWSCQRQGKEGIQTGKSITYFLIFLAILYSFMSLLAFTSFDDSSNDEVKNTHDPNKKMILLGLCLGAVVALIVVRYVFCDVVNTDDKPKVKAAKAPVRAPTLFEALSTPISAPVSTSISV